MAFAGCVAIAAADDDDGVHHVDAHPRAPVAGASTALRRVALGRSVQGRPIRALVVGDPGATATALVVGNVHGDETAGFAVVKRLREQKQTRRIPILILTVKDLTDEERRILQSGTTKFLTKSYASKEALLHEVVEMLQGALRGDFASTRDQKVSPDLMSAADPVVAGGKKS